MITFSGDQRAASARTTPTDRQRLSPTQQWSRSTKVSQSGMRPLNLSLFASKFVSTYTVRHIKFQMIKDLLSRLEISGYSYKQLTLVIYNFRVVLTRNFHRLRL